MLGWSAYPGDDNTGQGKCDLQISRQLLDPAQQKSDAQTGKKVRRDRNGIVGADRQGVLCRDGKVGRAVADDDVILIDDGLDRPPKFRFSRRFSGHIEIYGEEVLVRWDQV